MNERAKQLQIDQIKLLFYQENYLPLLKYLNKLHYIEQKYLNKFLLWACKNNHFIVVKVLINKKLFDPETRNIADGNTPLIFAVINENIEIVQIILENFPQLIDVKSNSGMTALIWASYKKSKDIVQLLVAAGADVNIKNNDGLTALAYANEESITEILLKAGAKRPKNICCNIL